MNSGEGRRKRGGVGVEDAFEEDERREREFKVCVLPLYVKSEKGKEPLCDEVSSYVLVV